MEGGPARYKKATAALDETARGRLCESSGSDRSSGSSPELADLVDCFYGEEEEGKEESSLYGGSNGAGGGGLGWSEREILEDLVELIGGDLVGRKIREAAEVAWMSLGNGLTPGVEERAVKWRLMRWLREMGFDAGLCKSGWDKNGRFPGGDHEYIDVFAEGGVRYIVEVNLSVEFEIARPTPHYTSLLEALPPVFVGRASTLADVVRLMCSAAKESMRIREMHVPPWRRKEYMHVKWFGSSCKRTTAKVGKKGGGGVVEPCSTRAVGFGGQKYCGVQFGRLEERKLKLKLEVGLFRGMYM